MYLRGLPIISSGIGGFFTGDLEYLILFETFYLRTLCLCGGVLLKALWLLDSNWFFLRVCLVFFSWICFCFCVGFNLHFCYV